MNFERFLRPSRYEFEFREVSKLGKGGFGYVDPKNSIYLKFVILTGLWWKSWINWRIPSMPSRKSYFARISSMTRLAVSVCDYILAQSSSLGDSRGYDTCQIRASECRQISLRLVSIVCACVRACVFVCVLNLFPNSMDGVHKHAFEKMSDIQNRSRDKHKQYSAICLEM